ncbi:MAG: 4Fe-4S binding protein [Gemmatimonadota bacterium]|nr:4Fe-4S binding protein [Gemmatimonadota bacterium]
MSTASFSGSLLTLPPPQYHASICAAGEDGETGCRRCVESCPYLAMRPLATPEGTVIHIDGGLCQRCGACTGVCPTGALERAFLPDDELIGLLEEAVTEAPTAPLLVLAGTEHDAALGAFVPPSGPVARVTIPSLLILNENHFLHAARLGVAGIAVVGGPLSHHGSPALIEDALGLSEALGGPPTRYVEARAAAQIAIELTAFADSLPIRNPPPEPALAPRGRRREQLAALVQGSTVPSAPVPEAAFGRVSIQADGCTLCGACSRSCPTDALSFHPAQGSLTFEPIACVGCGLCEAACPEQVLTLTPGLPVGVDLLAPQTLVEDTVAACVSCGAPHLPERLLRSVRNLLDGRSDLPAEVAQIDRCPACRTIGVVEPEPVSAPQVARPAESGCGCSSETCCSSQPAQTTPAEPGVGRRSFLQGIGTALSALATLAAGGAPAQTPGGPAAAPKARRLGMVIDLEKCIGCHACTVACKAENDVPLGVFRDWVEEHLLGEFPDARPYFLPKLCNQCDDPGCLRACPTGAIFRRGDGIIDLEPDICIGCRACNQACPYGITFMNPARGTADKCNFCAHRIDEGLNPACVDVCPSQCRIFGDLNDDESPVSQYLRDRSTQVLRRDLGLGPNVHYVGLPAELNR